MKKIYLIIGFILVLYGVYMCGKKISVEQCRAEFAIKQNENTIKIQKNIIKTQGKIDEETFNTDTNNIRMWLRQRYTIKN